MFEMIQAALLRISLIRDVTVAVILPTESEGLVGCRVIQGAGEGSPRKVAGRVQKPPVGRRGRDVVYQTCKSLPGT